MWLTVPGFQRCSFSMSRSVSRIKNHSTMTEAHRNAFLVSRQARQGGSNSQSFTEIRLPALCHGNVQGPHWHFILNLQKGRMAYWNFLPRNQAIFGTE
jgi:hypothetical protein